MGSEQIHGWFDWQEVYSAWAREARPGAVFVEVGVFLGKSVSFLCDELRGKDATIYAIDPWLDDSATVNTWGGHKTPFLLFLETMREHAPEGLERIKVIRAPSVRAAQMFGSGEVDYTWIDGDHSYEGVLADIRAWLPRTRVAIGGHDFVGAHHGVPRAVCEAFPDGGFERPGISWLKRLGDAQVAA